MENIKQVERIEAKKAELLKTFEALPEEKLKVARDLIGQAAFLAVTLEDLAEVIGQEGMVEKYVNGQHQHGRKISSNAKVYSSLINKYNTIITGLLKLVPENKQRAKDVEAERYAREEAHRKEVREASERAKSETIRRIADGLAYDALKKGEISQDEFIQFRDDAIERYRCM